MEIAPGVTLDVVPGVTLSPKTIEKYRALAMAMGVVAEGEKATFSVLDMDAAQRFISQYMDDWWATLETSTRKQLREALAKVESGEFTPEDLYATLEPLFGERRAQLIAQNEMTNVIGQAAQASYRENGVGWWQWNTVNDPFVDEVCRELEGLIFAIDDPFEGAHVGCRCFPSPANVEPEPLESLYEAGTAQGF